MDNRINEVLYADKLDKEGFNLARWELNMYKYLLGFEINHTELLNQLKTLDYANDRN